MASLDLGTVKFHNMIAADAEADAGALECDWMIEHWRRVESAFRAAGFEEPEMKEGRCVQLNGWQTQPSNWEYCRTDEEVKLLIDETRRALMNVGS